MAAGIPTAFAFGTKVTAAAAAANYLSAAQTKGVKWATNYLHSPTDPFAAAIAQAPHWLARLNEVGTAGYTAGLGRVNRTRVATLVSQHGPSLYAAGITNKGGPNYAAAATEVIPAIQQAAANLPPRGTDAQNEQRMILMRRSLMAMRGIHRAK